MRRILVLMALLAAGCPEEEKDPTPTDSGDLETDGPTDVPDTDETADTAAGETDTDPPAGDGPTVYGHGLQQLVEHDLTTGTSRDVTPSGQSLLTVRGPYAVTSVQDGFTTATLYVYAIATGDLVGTIADAQSPALVRTPTGWRLWYAEFGFPTPGAWHSVGVDGTGDQLEPALEGTTTRAVTPDGRHAILCTEAGGDQADLVRVAVEAPGTALASRAHDAGIEPGRCGWSGFTADGHLIRGIDDGLSDVITAVLDADLNVAATYPFGAGYLTFGGAPDSALVWDQADDAVYEIDASGTKTSRSWLNDAVSGPARPSPTDVASTPDGWMILNTWGFEEKIVARPDGTEQTLHTGAPGGSLSPIHYLGARPAP